MKFKKFLNLASIFLFSFLTLFSSAFIVYFYGFKNFQTATYEQSKLKQPVFSQEETNWMVDAQGIIFKRFKVLLEQKTTLKVLNYQVNDSKQISNIKVTLANKNKLLEWFYQLEY